MWIAYFIFRQTGQGRIIAYPHLDDLNLDDAGSLWLVPGTVSPDDP